ncbi:Fe-S cluster assembly protein SufD [Aphanothece hegewaldii CCALA 016]|uniref:Fe-S cluster assembly protein SufD n=1 Tax=Aphanothece hegewaldii CCALA 016 TaxID=2107694 RepID=A0A2T1LW00_9CHRO|nr:Fe-S cluster assembly protein SufD [Aphanothece hegewaldii]PSF36041.1 Fe-S cluster assembly protein SufD [Aphanothece hegewaldii CCALA 016]
MTSIILEPTKTDNDEYLQKLVEQNKAKISAEWLNDLRKDAVTEIQNLKLPHRKDEEWQFIDLSELRQTNFQTAQNVELSTEALNPFILPEAGASRLVFVNGFYAANLSDASTLPDGVFVGNLSELAANARKEKIVKYLGQQKGDVFTTLNTTDLSDAAVVWVNPDIVVETPIHLLFLTIISKTPAISQPRILVVAERGAKLQLVEYYGAVAKNCSDVPRNLPYLTNVVSEIYIEENAEINHTRIQRESGDGFQIARSAIAQSRDSRYTCNDINFGGKLSRHQLDIYQNGEQTETNLYGLTLIGREQTSDTHSAIYLNHPYGTTNQLHKCIVDNSAHAVFNGKVFVPKAAQMTNAAQLNRNLVLSPKARVNTKPELQITADNVKCSHGATVSQLEADELFYLRSRGLTEDNARHLLLDAFAAEILDKIPLKSLRQRLSQCVACRTID